MPQSSGPGSALGPLPAQERKLEGWGEIALYLRREIRTVQRWERNLALPIHRLPVGKGSAVYAYASELDEWYREREAKIRAEGIQHADETSSSTVETKEHEISPPAPAETKVESKGHSQRRNVFWLSSIAVPLVVVLLLLRFGFVLPFFKPEVAAQPSAKLRLFVRPFQTVAGDAAQTEFDDGLTSEINNRLGRLDPDHLGVIAPTSASILRDKPISELDRQLKL